MIDCPQCGAMVLPSTIVDRVAQCTECEHLFELPGEGEAPAPAVQTVQAVEPHRVTDAPRPPPPQPHVPTGQLVPSPPHGAYMKRHAQGVEVTLPWRSDIGIGGHILQVVITLGFAYGAQQATSESQALAVGLALAAGVFTYSWLYYLVNRTTVLIAPKGVEISHGPLPSLNFRSTYRPAELRPLSVETVVKGFGRGRRTVYELHASMTAKKVLTDWNHRATVAYVRDCIQAVQGEGLHIR